MGPINKKSNGMKTKNKKNQMLRRNSPVIMSVESVLQRPESVWWERFVKEVGFEP